MASRPAGPSVVVDLGSHSIKAGFGIVEKPDFVDLVPLHGHHPTDTGRCRKPSHGWITVPTSAAAPPAFYPLLLWTITAGGRLEKADRNGTDF